jgi:hypothetical protein
MYEGEGDLVWSRRRSPAFVLPCSSRRRASSVRITTYRSARITNSLRTQANGLLHPGLADCGLEATALWAVDYVATIFDRRSDAPLASLHETTMGRLAKG